MQRRSHPKGTLRIPRSLSYVASYSAEQCLFVACREVISGRVLGREGGRIPLILQGFSEKWCVYQAGAGADFRRESA